MPPRYRFRPQSGTPSSPSEQRLAPLHSRSSSHPTGRSEVTGHVMEPLIVPLEGDDDVTGGTIAVLSHDDVGLTGPFGLLVVDLGAVQQDHHIGVLLNGA